MKDLSVTELLEEIAAGLFGEHRSDRIIIGYRFRSTVSITRDFLVGKAMTYHAFTCKEIVLEGGEGKHPIDELAVGFCRPDSNCIYSVELSGVWTESQLEILSRKVEMFSQLKVLFWVQRDALKRYLPHLFELCQLCRIYHIADALTLREVEPDTLLPELIEPSDQEMSEWPQTTREYVELLESFYDSSQLPTAQEDG